MRREYFLFMCKTPILKKTSDSICFHMTLPKVYVRQGQAIHLDKPSKAVTSQTRQRFLVFQHVALESPMCCDENCHQSKTHVLLSHVMDSL